ncbi:MAG: bifunctional (p)ppGpp synthetase/guanosine-3',5'-bis(diphosphate) 3'-pyrophosphohydrolase [Cyclobacteriaceae bacterium]|nr:bifunctional (p)ppGpp synthetase/guanosine-3',5'-bis(diphosphate) 3'-pyrophosphohydrolase [Cyclobacteriaceae bacterium]
MLDEEIEEEKKDIIRRYRRLLRHAKPLLKDGDAKIIKKAFHTSMEAHKNMRRKSGEPYIFHPLAVAQICVEEIGLGTTSIVCALMHDVVEDTETSLADVEYLFGKKVAKIIDGLTKISGVFDQGTSQQAENFRKMLLTLSDDVRVILIKLADRLHNMRTLESMPHDKQLKIASETSYIYAPLAHRLGLYTIKSEMEDLCLKYTDSEVYEEISNKINATKSVRNKFIRNFIRPLKDELDKLGMNYQIKGRPKSIHSILSKMRKQNVPFEEVFDLFAIRIIIDAPLHKEKALCWQVYSIVTDYYQPNPDRLRDWISIPKANGYESLHSTVMSDVGQWVEVQIRTMRMDEIAEKGYAAHWKYKENKGGRDDSGLEMWISKVRDILEQSDTSAIEFVSDFRSNLYNEEVFVFTPKGDLMTLPHGATALDFAFDIHSEVGAHCIGAKVNQKLVPLNYELKNGDQVEILTSKKQKPTEDWLKIVVSSRAKSKIKDSLKEEKKIFSNEGKEIIRRKLKQMKLPYDQEILEQMTAFFNVKTPTDLYYMVGKGKIDHTELKQFREKKKEVKKKATLKVIENAEHPKEVSPAENKDLLVIGENTDYLDYKLARCCNPIPGDDVFGFVTVSDGIKIHRTNCPNGAELLSNYGYRVIKAKWTARHDIAFLAGLNIIGTDRIGIISDVSNVISSELKVNMRSMSITTDNGIFEGEIQLYVDDTQHLDQLIRKLEEIQGVVNVSRCN